MKPPPKPVVLPVKHYQGAAITNSTRYLHEGAFAQAFDRFWPLDPNYDGNLTRLRIYHVCAFARVALAAEGDFVTAGVSYGVAPRTMYELLDLPAASRTLWLIDPFVGAEAVGSVAVLDKYNQSQETVARQYPEGAPVRFHAGFIPACLPLPGNPPLAFVHVNTGDVASEASSLSHFWRALSAGGIIVIDNYAIGSGHEDEFHSAISGLEDCSSVSLVTGQIVLFKVGSGTKTRFARS